MTPSPDPDQDQTPVSRSREVTLLQQQNRTLQCEIQLRKEAETSLREELHRQSEHLMCSLRFSEMFVGILGHELRNPLSAIATAASLLRRRADSEKVATPAGRILNSAVRMGRMIDQLLDFTQIRLGNGIATELRNSDLVEICRLAIREMESQGAPASIELGASGSSWGWWDPARLLQLISNLLSNAVIHGNANGAVTLRVDGTPADCVLLDIHNSGVVAQGMVPLLFEPYRVAENNKTAGSNALGLGLFISQKIVVAHAGTIDVTSSEMEGTHFTVKLPRQPPGRQPTVGPERLEERAQ